MGVAVTLLAYLLGPNAFGKTAVMPGFLFLFSFQQLLYPEFLWYCQNADENEIAATTFA